MTKARYQAHGWLPPFKEPDCPLATGHTPPQGAANLILGPVQ